MDSQTPMPYISSSEISGEVDREQQQIEKEMASCIGVLSSCQLCEGFWEGQSRTMTFIFGRAERGRSNRSYGLTQTIPFFG